MMCFRYYLVSITSKCPNISVSAESCKPRQTVTVEEVSNKWQSTSNSWQQRKTNERKRHEQTPVKCKTHCVVTHWTVSNIRLTDTVLASDATYQAWPDLMTFALIRANVPTNSKHSVQVLSATAVYYH